MEEELPTRQFRASPFCWQEKTVLRLLRKRYAKRVLPSRRAVYLALSEIDSDFREKFVRNYTKTIATYAGVDRHLVSKILGEFAQMNLIKIEILRDEKGKFVGRTIYLLECPMADEPPVDNPPVENMPHKKKGENIYKNIEDVREGTGANWGISL